MPSLVHHRPWILILLVLLSRLTKVEATSLDDSPTSNSTISGLQSSHEELSNSDELCDPIFGCGETAMGMLLFAFILVLAGAVVVVYIVETLHWKFLPESIAVVMYGVLVGVVLRFIKSEITHRLAEFDPEKFFLFALPAIIFETGFSMSKTAFFGNIKGIILLASFGTVISFLVIGFGIWSVGMMGASFYLPLKESLLIGSLLSSTDPVATLAIFQALNVDQVLYMLVLGESVLNDAVALVLYRTISDSTSSSSLVGISWSVLIFFAVSAGSIILGVAIALLLSIMLRNINFGRFPALETIFMLLFSYMSYVLADGLKLSPILAVFFCGVVFNHYGAYSLSPYTKLTSRQLFRTMAFICETCVFIYIGMSIATMELVFDVGLIIWGIVFCLLGRALNVFPLMFLHNRLRPHKKVSRPVQVMVWFAGLRGAIAFSLALDVQSAYAPHIRTMTLVIVHFSLITMGCGTLPLLKLLNIRSAASDQSLENITKLPAKEKEKNRPARTSIRFYHNMDDRYFKLWFRRKVPPISIDAVEVFERLVSNSQSQEMVDTFAAARTRRHEDDEEELLRSASEDSSDSIVPLTETKVDPSSPAASGAGENPGVGTGACSSSSPRSSLGGSPLDESKRLWELASEKIAAAFDRSPKSSRTFIVPAEDFAIDDDEEIPGTSSKAAADRETLLAGASDSATHSSLISCSE